ncbi:MAG: hypothetical protein KJ063_25660, partial [Anaerolineae bacterium]|nr:hypothetical protein [Anaerolineae bacterium]
AGVPAAPPLPCSTCIGEFYGRPPAPPHKKHGRTTPFPSRATFAVYGRAQPHTFHGYRDAPGNNATLEARNRTAENGPATGKRMWRGGDTGHSNPGRPCQSR